MSKHLRTFLLSALIIVLACSSAFAATEITFKWTGSVSNQWGYGGNWDAFIGSGDAIVSTDYASIKSSIGKLNDAMEFYPGKVLDSSDVSVDVYVLISKDATISMTNVGHISNVKAIHVTGTSSQTANVIFNMDGSSWFEDTPNITVGKSNASLRINATRDPAINIKNDATWQSKGGALYLNFDVAFLANATLTLSTDNTLTIAKDSLLGENNSNRKTAINVSGTGKLVFAVTPETERNGRGLDITLSGSAPTIEVASGYEITLNAWSEDVKPAVNVTTATTFTKAGAGTLTLNRADKKHRTEPVLSSDVTTIKVTGGTLAITGSGYAPLTYSGTTPTFRVDSGATLDLGSKTLSADSQVRFVTSGDVIFASNAIDANDVYTGGALALNSNVSADIRSTGTLTFGGTQAVKGLKGSGTLQSNAAGAMLILDCASADIDGFTGTIKSLDVGIKTKWEVIPFLTKAADGSSINNLYVFGDGGELELDQAKLSDIDGLETTNVYLRSNIIASNTTATLKALKVGKLSISGDIALGVVSVDGALDVDGVGEIEFLKDGSKLTVDKLVLHANADKDFKASSSSANIYVSVRAIHVNGNGTLIPKAIANGTTSDSVNVGNEDSIVVEGATLKLNGVEFPANNSLLLRTASIDVDNGTRIKGNFIVAGHSRIRVALTGDNARPYETSSDIQNGAIIVDNTFKVSTDKISVDIVSIEDPARFLGKMYNVVSYTSRDLVGQEVTSVDVGLTEGVYKENNSVSLGLDESGLYAYLTKWMVHPEVDVDWEFLHGQKTFGRGDEQFEASIRYFISDDITPKEDMEKLVRPIFTIEGQAFDWNDRVDRTSVVKDGRVLAFIEVSTDRAARKIYLSGTSYKTSLDISINLSWDKSGFASLAKSNTVRINTTAGGSLSNSRHNGTLKTEDLVAVTRDRPIMNKDRENPTSGDIYDTDAVVSGTGSNVFVADGDGVYEFRVEGITKTTTTSGLPRLVNGLYVWDNGYDTSSTYTITISGDAVEIRDFQLVVGGRNIPMASVDIEADGSNAIKVTVPVSLLGTTTGAIPEPKEVELTAKTANGDTVHIPAPSVTLVPATYTAGTPAQATYSFTEGKIPTAEQTVTTGDLSGDDVQYIITGNAPAGITWNNAAGAVSYTLAQDTAPGNYDVTVYAYNGTQTYGYTFAIVVAEGFRVRPEEPYTDYIAGTNYVAYFTASNAPEGVIEWTTSTLPAWATATKSGDTFVVFGQLPAYIADYDDVDPNEVSFTVTAAVAGESQSATISFTVAEDTDTTGEPAASAVTSTGDIHTADRNYSVTINYTADDYGSEIDPFNLPYWLTATPILGGDDGDEVRGYTISFRAGAEVARGATGVVRYTDLAGNIISWAVTFNDDTTPQPVEALAIAASPATLNIAAGTTSVVTMSATNAIGTVTYTTNQSWAVVNGNRITITAPSASATVTVTGTDAGRTENATATTTITVTVTSGSGGDTPGGDTPGGDTPGGDEPTVTVPVVTAVTRFSDSNVESADVTADRDVTSWAVYVNGSVETWAAITATGARTARVMLNVPSDLPAGTYAITVTATDANGTSSRTSVGSFTVASTDNFNNPGGSSGGCDAGFGAMALAFAAPLFLRRRRS